MKIGHIELFVSDTKTSLEFYVNKLGFEHVADQGELQWVKLGEVEILLRPGKNTTAPNYQESSHGLVIYTDNMKESTEKLRKNGITFLGTDMTDNCLTFTDPDGHWFQLVNPNH